MTESKRQDDSFASRPKKFIKDQTVIASGNVASAWAARCARVQVISAYPITPQTTVVEKISDFVENGDMPECEYIRVESEHSVMGALVGASLTGARAFTATSGQGLLYMSELLAWATRARLPLVMTCSSRGIGPPWNIWAEFTDATSQRDQGWLMCFASNHQEIYDSILQGFCLAENEEIMLPVMVAYGGFVQSHTSRPFHVPDQHLVDELLPEVSKSGWAHTYMDPARPRTHGNLQMPGDFYYEFQYLIHDAHMRAKEAIPKIAEKARKILGENHYHGGLIKEYRCEDAQYAMICYGELADQAEECVDRLRADGMKVGAIKLRFIRPFPTEALSEVASRIPNLIVLDRASAFGAPTGSVVSTEIMGALYRADVRPTILPVIAGLGGRDVPIEQQMSVFNVMADNVEKGVKLDDAVDKAKNGKFRHGTLWLGMK